MNQAAEKAQAEEANLEALAAELEASAQYRVLRQFNAQERYGPAQTEGITSVAFLDVETTGVDVNDVPIEIGVVRVEYDAESGNLGRVLERYQGFQDPGRPLPDYIVALTGITDADLRGKTFEEDQLMGLIKRSSIVVAHHANFDRSMAEKLFPWMANRPWGCTIKDVPWKEAGVASSKLEFVAMTRGLFYGAHRALEDAEVCAAVAGKPLLDGKPAFQWVLEQARATWYRVWATEAPFESRSRLKDNGYEWRDGSDGGHKGWRTLTRDPVEEIEFLAKEIYGHRGTVLLQELGRNDRFSERFQSEEWVSLSQRRQ